MATKTATQPTAPPATTPQRQLQVLKGRIDAPLRILLGGIEGIGKTTWGSKAPKPIFLGIESGSNELDVERFVFDADTGRTEPESWPEVQTALRDLATLPHDYQTLVVDTVDALEPMMWRTICVRGNKSNIEEFGYGKGYVAALDEWRIFLSDLERLRRERKMHVVLVAHTHIKLFKNPEGDDYDRHEFKLHIKAGGLLKEWCDDVLFAHYETYAVKGDGERKAKGISTGARVVETVRTAAWDAKNRHNLPSTLSLDYDAFAAAVKQRGGDPAEIRKSIAAKLAELGDADVAGKVQQLVDAAGDSSADLATIDNRMTATLAQRRKKGA
jgi:hypothetical protein